jgi:putative redox protein
MTESAKAVVVSENSAKPFGQDISDGRHEWVADEPTGLLGQDTGPGPYELLASSLGACTSMTLRMYATKKSWPLEHVSVKVSHNKVDGADQMHREIVVRGALDDEQVERLLDIANRCPVHKTLSPAVAITSVITRL